MKKLSLFVSALALLSSSAYAAIDCKTLPTCSDLGYKDKVAECPSSAEVLKCPFDTTWGKCTRGPSVGDLKYSLNTANHNGWILCNGQGIDKTKYAELFKIIGTNYGGSGNNFYVPDYRGFFLRAYGTASVNKPLSSYGGSANSSLKDPQKEELPNITGTLKSFVNYPKIFNAVGVFTNSYNSSVTKDATESNSKYWGEGGVIGFNAGKSSPIYVDGGHVIPANYAANIFIYAGR